MHNAVLLDNWPRLFAISSQLKIELHHGGSQVAKTIGLPGDGKFKRYESPSLCLMVANLLFQYETVCLMRILQNRLIGSIILAIARWQYVFRRVTDRLKMFKASDK